MLGYHGDAPDSGQMWKGLSSRTCKVGIPSIPAISTVVLSIEHHCIKGSNLSSEAVKIDELIDFRVMN